MPTQAYSASHDAVDTPWLDVDQASEYLGYSATSIRRWCRAKKIRHARSPGRNSCYRFRREWLDEFLEERTVNPDGVPYVPKNKRPVRISKPLSERQSPLGLAVKKRQERARQRQSHAAGKG